LQGPVFRISTSIGPEGGGGHGSADKEKAETKTRLLMLLLMQHAHDALKRGGGCCACHAALQDRASGCRRNKFEAHKKHEAESRIYHHQDFRK
jgi:hypothetical protein